MNTPLTDIQIESSASIIFIGTVIGLFGLVIFLLLRLERQKKQQQAILEAHNAVENKLNALQLQSIESKLQPHLLKNILNSVQSHAYQTYHVLDKLASVLDYMLYESRNKFVSPREEIDFALNLIEINKIKVSPLFEMKLKTNIGAYEPLYEQQLLAPLISIDLIENAFKHADLQSTDAFIAITFSFNDGIFSLTVANKISAQKPMRKENSGIGGESLEQRLKIIYQDNFKLDKFIEQDVFIAHLKINLLDYKAKMFVAG